MKPRVHLEKLESFVDTIVVLPNDDGSYRVHVNYIGGVHPISMNRRDMAAEIAEVLYEHIGRIRHARK